MNEDQYLGTFEEFFELAIEGETPYGAIWDHLNEYENLENVHNIHYETLLEVGYDF